MDGVDGDGMGWDVSRGLVVNVFGGGFWRWWSGLGWASSSGGGGSQWW